MSPRACFRFDQAWIDSVSRGGRIEDVGLLDPIFNGTISEKDLAGKFWYWEASSDSAVLKVRDRSCEPSIFRKHLQVKNVEGRVGLFALCSYEEGDVISIVAGGQGNKRNALMLGGECAEQMDGSLGLKNANAAVTRGGFMRALRSMSCGDEITFFEFTTEDSTNPLNFLSMLLLSEDQREVGKIVSFKKNRFNEYLYEVKFPNDAETKYFDRGEVLKSIIYRDFS